MASRSHRLPLRPLVALVFVLALLALPALASAQSDSALRAQEQYYSSYGSPTPIPTAAPATSDGPGWTVALLGGVAILLVGAGLGLAGSRALVRPRGASVA